MPRMAPQPGQTDPMEPATPAAAPKIGGGFMAPTPGVNGAGSVGPAMGPSSFAARRANAQNLYGPGGKGWEMNFAPTGPQQPARSKTALPSNPLPQEQKMAPPLLGRMRPGRPPQRAGGGPGGQGQPGGQPPGGAAWFGPQGGAQAAQQVNSMFANGGFGQGGGSPQQMFQSLLSQPGFMQLLQHYMQQGFGGGAGPRPGGMGGTPTPPFNGGGGGFNPNGGPQGGGYF
jgi:translation initiation factor IF-2